MSIKEEDENFRKLMGDVLAKALHVESTLEFFISNYFIKPQNDKTFFFNDVILLKSNFENKIRLFKEICKREKFDENNVSKIVNSIKYVKDIRNKVAHWQLESTINEQIRLRKRTSFTTKKDILKLDKDDIKKLEEETSKAIRGINQLYLKYYKEGTIDERPQDRDVSF